MMLLRNFCKGGRVKTVSHEQRFSAVRAIKSIHSVMNILAIWTVGDEDRKFGIFRGFRLENIASDNSAAFLQFNSNIFFVNIIEGCVIYFVKIVPKPVRHLEKSNWYTCSGSTKQYLPCKIRNDVLIRDVS